MRGRRAGAIVMAISGLLTGCGNDGSTAPSPVDLAGVYYGTVSNAEATCEPELPPGIDGRAYDQVRLFEATVAGSTVSFADLTDTLHYVGTFDGSTGVVSARFGSLLNGAAAENAVDTIHADVSGNPLHLTGTGDRTVTIDWANPSQPDDICHRQITWDLPRRSTPIPDLARHDCSEEAVLRPEGSLSSTIILVRNGLAEAVDIYRLDNQGIRVQIDHVEPGGSLALAGIGLASEPLLVTHTDGTCLGIYLSAEGPSYLRLTEDVGA
jgi:hypothetical protein